METSLPALSVPRRAPVMEVNHVFPELVNAVVLAPPFMENRPDVIVEEAFEIKPDMLRREEKELEPEKVLSLARRVEEAAETVMVPPLFKVVPLMVPRGPVR